MGPLIDKPNVERVDKMVEATIAYKFRQYLRRELRRSQPREQQCELCRNGRVPVHQWLEGRRLAPHLSRPLSLVLMRFSFGWNQPQGGKCPTLACPSKTNAEFALD
jgi:hypothetical protein